MCALSNPDMPEVMIPNVTSFTTSKAMSFPFFISFLISYFSANFYALSLSCVSKVAFAEIIGIRRVPLEITNRIGMEIILPYFKNY